MATQPNELPLEQKARQGLASLVSGPQWPQNPFLVEGLTFEELHDQARAIAHQNQSLADNTGPLCLCAEDKGRVAAALLAALIQGTPLLIPYAFDQDTLANARKGLPYTHALIEPGYGAPKGIVKRPWPQAAHRQAPPSSREALAWDDPWLYLFTGGSTGTPQIWSKTPHNLLMEAVYLIQAFDISSNDTILSTVPTNHIYGLLYSILLPLLSGARVSVRTPSFPNEIREGLDETRATILVSIPPHYRALKKHPITQTRVRTAFSSAGALAEQDALEFYNTTGIAITEIYGSTETGGIAQRNRAEGQTTLHPFACVDVQMDHHHLGVKSHFLSNELEKNAEGYFETADRAQWSEPSGFSLLGRSDGIVKVGGKRVDLAATKEALMAVDGVRDVYVFTRPVQSGRENEILALVEGDVSTDLLVQAAHGQLPAYARPRMVKVAPKMPLSPTGKYHRTAIEAYFKPIT